MSSRAQQHHLLPDDNDSANAAGRALPPMSLSPGAEQTPKRTPFWRHPFSLIAGAAVVIIAIVIIILKVEHSPSGNGGGSAYANLNECLAANRPPNFSAKQTGPLVPPSLPAPSTPPSVLFTHASIWTGVDALRTDADLLIQNGKVVSVSPASGQRLPVPKDDSTLEVYDATGLFITPGLIDMHSHAGLAAWPGDLWATDDVNEMTNPTFAQLRAVDAIDPRDPAFPAILAHGVTTSQVMPGSGDAMGGEGAIVKNRGRTIQDMLVPGAPRLMKMACGENPKRVFGKGAYTKGVGATPMSRLGSAWVMRHRLEQARALVDAQDAWCTASGATQRSTPFPQARENESLAALLRGEVKLNTHCYLTQDFEMMLRLSAEFGFHVSTFHHALSAWRIPDVMAWSNISVAIFADHSLYKHEAYDASVTASKVLHDAGVNTVIKTDHPVLFSGTLGWEAAKAHHYGMPAQAAIAAVTSAPAAAMGLADRIGALRPGLDADVTVWDRDPLVLGARARTVFVEGHRLVDTDAPVVAHADSTVVAPEMTSAGPASVCGLYNDSAIVESDQYRTVGLACYAVLDVALYDGTAPRVDVGSMVVQNGIITCVGPSASCAALVATLPPECQLFRAEGGVLTPGFIEAGGSTGLYDISSESSTGDGGLGGDGTDGGYAAISTADGLRAESRHVRAAWAAGITTVIARPVGSQLVAGVSSAFRTCCGPTLAGLPSDGPQGRLVSSATALALTVGNAAKLGGTSSAISGQLAALRALFTQAQASNNGSSTPSASLLPFVRALRGELRVAVEVNQADEILAVLRLQSSFGFPLTIVSGAESGLVAAQLAAATPPASVLLFSRQLPNSFETLRAVPEVAALLAAAGVKFALSTGDTDMTRNLRWEAGWNLDASGLTEQQTVEAVTSNVADMFGLPSGRLAVGSRAEFVLFNGSPFSLQSSVQLVGMADQVDCRPPQR